MDRQLYRQAMQDEMRSTENLSVIECAVEDLICEDNRVAGVVTDDGQVLGHAVMNRTGQQRAFGGHLAMTGLGDLHSVQMRLPGRFVGKRPGCV